MGYSLEDEQTLELLLLTDISDAQTADAAKKAREKATLEERQRKLEEQQAARNGVAAELAQRGVSLADFEQLVRRGLRSVEQYRTFLRTAGYAAAAVSDLAELMTAQLQDAQAEQVRRAELTAEAKQRQISLTDLEAAVKRGYMSVDEYRSQLAALGFADQDREMMARLLQGDLDLALEAAKRRDTAQVTLAAKQISLVDLERAVRRGLRTVVSYKARLITEGMDSDDAATLADMLSQDVAADDAARAKRAEIEKTLKKRKVSLADLEAAVRAGLVTMAQYRAELATQGYSDVDADMLVRLLDLDMQAAAAAAAKRTEAEARLAQQHVSLSDVEQAVLAGVADLAAYRAFLTRQGFSADDQELLVGTLTARLAEVRQAASRQRTVSTAAAKKGISVADYEAAVRAGLRSTAEYRAWLVGTGVSDADAATLTQLLEMTLAQDQAARAKRAEAEADLRARGLSLAQMEQAVLEGVQTLQQYAAWLGAQGYRDVDQAVLVALLAGELERRAAA